MNRRQRIAISIVHGPEVRAFLHSGLAPRLAETFDVVLLVARPTSTAFAGLDSLRILPLPVANESRCLDAWRSLALNAQLGWLRSRGQNRWTHYLDHQPGSWKRRVGRRVGTALGRVPALAPLVRAAERRLGRGWGTQPAWQRLFDELEIDGLLTASFAASAALPALQTAANLGRKTVVATSSWKDVYATTNVSVVPTRLIVWSQRAARDLIAMNPHVAPDRVAVCESLHLEPFWRPAALMPRAELCRRLGLDPHRPYLCYSAAAPAAVVNEEQIVGLLLAAIQRGEIPGQPQLLVRLNPMEDGRRFAALAAPGNGLIIQRPVWEWDPATDWCCALPADVPLWVATAWHAALNVSIPSTVTREFGAIGRPVVNVCFDWPVPLPPARSNRRLWEAEFYAETRESGLAEPAFSKEELVAQIAQRLGVPPAANPPPHPGPGPVESVLAVMKDVFTA